MARFNSPLDYVRVAAPCDANWDSMFGDERVRFCAQCKLNVYNLSDMTKLEAERLIARTDGRLCIRYYMRRDGSILTNNCPVGLRKIKRRLSRVATAIGSTVISFLAGVGVYGLVNRDSSPPFSVAGQMVINRTPELIPLPPVGKRTLEAISVPPVVELQGQLRPLPTLGRVVIKKANQRQR
jgi:hypothetical protein